jgi:hypothetical protein
VPAAPPVAVMPVFAAMPADVAEPADDMEALAPAGFNRVIQFDDEKGEMFLQYHFFKNGEEFIYEKTVNVTDKPESERHRIIHDFEAEIELPGTSI